MRARCILGGLILLLASVAGCAPMSGGAPDKTAKLQQVGVVSLLGTTFKGFSHGITRIGNSTYTGDVADWNLDGFATTQLVDVMRQSNAVSVVPLNLQGKAASSFFPPKSEVVDMKPVVALARAQGLDTLVVLTLGYDYDYQLIGTGYGWYEIGWGPLNKRYVFALVRLMIIDVESGATLKETGALSRGVEPQVNIPWRDSFKEIPAEDLQLMRSVIERRLRVGIEQASARLGLVPPKST